MTDEIDPAGETKQISVAELLARNGQQVGSAASGRRRRGVKGGISVAELTGDVPIIRDVPSAGSRPSTHGASEPEVTRTDPTRSSAPRSFDRATHHRPNNAVDSTRDARPTNKQAASSPRLGDPTFGIAVSRADSQDAAPAIFGRSGSLRIDDAPPAIDATSSDAAPSDAAAGAEQDDHPSGTNAMAWSSQREPQLLSGADPREPFPAVDTETDKQDESKAGPEPSAMRQWLVLLGQAVVAVVAGALLFTGFERLWDMLPWVAFALAILVILGLVAMVRILRKTDDILSIVIAIVVGLFVTMGPLVFLLSTS